MKSNDLFKMAGSNLGRRKSRTFLTLLGIVIGTISIVLMVALGLGMKENINKQFESMNSINVIEVSKGDNVSGDTRKAEMIDNGNLQDMDLDFFSSIDGVEAVSPVIQTNMKIVSGKYEATIQVIGIDTSMMDILGYSIGEGRLLTSGDTNQLVFGVDAIDSFKEATSSNSRSGSNFFSFGGGGPGQPGGGGEMRGLNEDESSDSETSYNVDVFNDRMRMTLDTSYSPTSTATSAQVIRTQGVGILEEGDMTRDRYVYMNIDTLLDMEKDYSNVTGNSLEDGYDKAYVKVKDINNIDSIQSYIENYGYTTSTSGSFIETIQSTTDTLQIALGAIGAVALLVAGIGITNTMIMAIQERKKEIGVMKVIGATLKDIKRIFLLEAAMIGFIGGAIGIGLSVAATKILSSSGFSGLAMGGGRSASTVNFYIPTWLIIVGVIFTTFVGIVSGYIPAQQAMRSSALEAIRTE